MTEAEVFKVMLGFGSPKRGVHGVTLGPVRVECHSGTLGVWTLLKPFHGGGGQVLAGGLRNKRELRAAIREFKRFADSFHKATR